MSFLPQLRIGLALALSAAALKAAESPHGPLELDCALCHSTESWSLKAEPDFRHERHTAWPLAGAHESVACLSCHEDLRFRGLSTDCQGCHLDPHQGGLGETCQECHSTMRWLDPALLLRRHANSLFPLTGAHGVLSCGDCHSGSGVSQFAATPRECSACHHQSWQDTRQPPHGLSGLGTSCEDCHNTTRWASASGYRHESFPLTGAHASAPCLSCHVGDVFQGTSSQCYSCHQTEYLEGPFHVDNNYSTSCGICHGTTAWRPTSVDHAATSFPLLGAHLTTSCTACHVDGVYAGTPSDCWSCHQSEYQAALNPDHGAGRYPQDCGLCHSNTAWRPASFNHGLTDFPLTGAHVALSCADCHGSGTYSGLSAECQSCHLTDYQQTTNPNHSGADFPLACGSCHSTSSWSGATFNHDQQYFPVYSGSHRNEWSSCTDCHGNPGNYAEFSCLGCHEHSQSSMDGEHNEVGGYQWESQACLSCHPTGEENDRMPRRPKPLGMNPRLRHPLR